MPSHRLFKHLCLQSLCTLALCVTTPSAAQSTNAPLPERKAQKLEVIQQNIEKAKEQKSKLEAEGAALSQTMEETQEELVALGQQIQANERDLRAIKSRIEETQREKHKVEQQVEESYASMGNTVQALIRIRRIPPEALLVKPDAPLKTAQTSALLKDILPTIKTKAQNLSVQAQKLEELTLSLEQDKRKFEHVQTQLGKERKKVKELLDHRKKLYANVQHEIIISDTTIEKLTKEAKSLSDLMAKIERERKKKAAQELAARSKPRRVYSQKIPDTGTPVFPVTGAILTSFGEQDNIGADSRGITIEASPQALVVAPMSGKIQFASYFKNYGQLIIIEHKKGYHSLIGGLDHLDVRSGQIIKTGEPLGILPSGSSRKGLPTLYYELRHKGKPVNPAQKFANIKS